MASIYCFPPIIITNSGTININMVIKVKVNILFTIF